MQRLRQEIYDRGEYYRESPSSDIDMTEEQFRAALDPRGEASGINEALLEYWLERKGRPVPVDPDTLLAAQPESGTHSVIDMANGVSAEPRFATVSPLTADELVGVFGTVTPSSDQVQTWMANSGDAGRQRWFGTYVVSYRDDEPDKLHFFGFSGD